MSDDDLPVSKNPAPGSKWAHIKQRLDKREKTEWAPARKAKTRMQIDLVEAILNTIMECAADGASWGAPSAHDMSAVLQLDGTVQLSIMTCSSGERRRLVDALAKEGFMLNGSRQLTYAVKKE